MLKNQTFILHALYVCAGLCALIHAAMERLLSAANNEVIRMSEYTEGQKTLLRQ